MERNPLNWLADLYYGATQFPSGWTNPSVVWGHFPQSEIGDLQFLFFQELRAQGFRRTPWQLVFPGQTAGLIKPIPPQPDGINEYHTRFYDDGIIECELEIGRFESMHWAGPRRDGVELLNELMDRSITIKCHETRKNIKKLFGVKPYSEKCSRR